LRVRVPDAGWRRGLLRMQRDILIRLREVAGELVPERLGFVEGAVTTPPAGATQAPGGAAPEPAAATPTSVAAAAMAIPDAELRERFLAAAGRYLSRFGGRT
jgi:hypothetical protein